MNGLKIKDFLNYKFLSDVQFSPNGLHLCFLVHSPRIEKNDYESNLWIYDLKQEEFYRLTNSGKDKEFLWLNEKELLFISDRESGIEGETEVEEERNGETALFKINIAGGEAQHVDTLKKEVVNMQL
ncbi:MAG: hypothetical protein GWO20_08975, partial [Candidatus Korarchaeota archaeon]|nr:hypothetical protein [Candidatus Korarchaeota archaeon]NIU82758.1 hypothetical protein [Candidatus Thorarchaeota archaeon]NIW13252.1 hypothetical protein [Candidatus Thorarchaeota archaeon]NIW51379.1 hypothetical protein [Candidatus Korarchaeota archaeon]